MKRPAGGCGGGESRAAVVSGPAAAGGQHLAAAAGRDSLRLYRVKANRTRFAVSRRSTVVTARPRARLGTRFYWGVNRPSTVTIRIERIASGRLANGRCLDPRR